MGEKMREVLRLFAFLLIAQAAAEHIASHSGLPSFVSKGPDAFSVDLAWGDNVEQPQKISLSLEKSKAVPRRIPVYGMKDGEAQQTDLANMKHTNFYQDLNTHAAVSLTSFEGENYKMKGSFVHENEEYEIEPFHPEVHKRSLGAKQGDHIIKKRETSVPSDAGYDYILPEEGTPEYEMVMEVQERAKKRIKDYLSGKYDKNREKRQSLPTTTYTVQIYMVVDNFLYDRLKDSRNRVMPSWSVEDYILYYLGHVANEIDMRYRNINTTGISAISNKWTMSTKLSGVYIAKTLNDAPWTPTLNNNCDGSTQTLPATAGLKRLRSWAAGRPEAAEADAVMLMTGLNIQFGSCDAVGAAYLGTMCGFGRVSLNELRNSMVYAHELGHNLGSVHDSGGCSAQYVMSANDWVTSNSNRGNSWKFSDCSAIRFDAKMTSLGSSNCMLNSGSYISSWADDHVPPLGKKLSLDEQCKLYYNSTYEYSGASGICYALQCRVQNSSGSGTARGGAFQYTPCATGKWCYDEQCVNESPISSPEPKPTTTPAPCPGKDAKKAKCTINGEENIKYCEKAKAEHCKACADVLKNCCNRCRKLGVF